MTNIEAISDDPPVALTERQAWQLDYVQQCGFDPGEWFRPMDVGGNQVSHILAELADKGLVEWRYRAGHSEHSARGAKLYRLTAAGREWAD